MMLVAISFGLLLWHFLVFKARGRTLSKLLLVLPYSVDTLLLLSAIFLVGFVADYTFD